MLSFMIILVLFSLVIGTIVFIFGDDESSSAVVIFLILLSETLKRLWGV